MKKVQQYWVHVFNQRKIHLTNGDGLMKALLEANYASLCAQYGLNCEEITPALLHLKLVTGPEGMAPFFLLKYRPDNQSPLVIYPWDVGKEAGAQWLREAKAHAQQSDVSSHLAKTREIFGVSLRSDQLADMGLILAYEIARWGAAEGEGMVYGLDGIWYRLNRHLAFLPLV